MLPWYSHPYVNFNIAITMFAWLFIAHALFDYPLQGDWLAKAKNPTLDVVQGESIWFLALTSHASIQAGGVWIVTGAWQLASLEFVAHWIIDFFRCKGYFSYNLDQVLHVVCKATWVIFFIIHSYNL